MPRKKQDKSREEKAAESHFEVDESDVKYATEKKVGKDRPKEDILKNVTEKKVMQSKQRVSSVEKKFSKPKRQDLEEIESSPKRNSKRKRKKTTKRKTPKSSKRTTLKLEKYTPPNIELKDKGYEFIITEKPQAALKIASALGVVSQKNYNKVPYYEVNRKGRKIVVGCAVGHLFTLKQNILGSNVPIFDISWSPNYIARKNDFTKRYYDTLLKIAKNAGELTVATDFDVEGEVIGANVVKYICNQKDAKRMKFSTLTSKELEKAYENKLPTIEWGQAIAGETRHYLDWFYGINLSRALMNAIKTTGKFKLMSIGRVQGPALNLIVKKEKEIKKFKSQDYWQVFITVIEPKLELKYTKDIFDKEELKKFENLVGKTADAETKKTKQSLSPNPPFNLTTLQTEMYKFYGTSPSNTLRAAQSLYLAGLISYPRTSSQKLPDSIGYKEILDVLKIRYKCAKLITKSKPIEGKKTDPAHPSIYPTGNKPPVLSGDEEKVYNLIARRFLSLFCDDAVIAKKRITAKVDDLTFSTNGSQIEKKSWMEIYPSKLKETEVPDVEGKVEIIDSQIEQKETGPPKRYSQASIISELEKQNLGTKATRSSILETLYDRGYVKNQSIEATPLGISLIDTLEKYSPIIVDEKLTRHFEKDMEKIQDINYKKGHEKLIEKENEIIKEAKETITKIANDFEKNEKKIGLELVNANSKYIEQQKRENRIMTCPKCKKGNLAITYSKKTKRHFIACDAYPDCENTYSLPPNGIIKKTDKVCEECSFPMLMRLTKGRKPWIFCWNKDCPTNASWAKRNSPDDK